VTLPLTPFPSPQAKPQGRGGTRCFRDASGSARTPSLRSSASRPFARKTLRGKSHITPLRSMTCSSLASFSRSADRQAGQPPPSGRSIGNIILFEVVMLRFTETTPRCGPHVVPVLARRAYCSAPDLGVIAGNLTLPSSRSLRSLSCPGGQSTRMKPVHLYPPAPFQGEY